MPYSVNYIASRFRIADPVPTSRIDLSVPTKHYKLISASCCNWQLIWMIEDIFPRAGEPAPTRRRSMLVMLWHLPSQLFVKSLVSFQRKLLQFKLLYCHCFATTDLFCDLCVFCTSKGFILRWCPFWHPECNLPDRWAASHRNIRGVILGRTHEIH